MYPNYRKTFLDLEDVLIRKVVHADTFLQIHIETRPAEQICPCCSQKTRRIHDYRFQKIQDIPNLGKQVTLVLKSGVMSVLPAGSAFWNIIRSCHLITAERND